MFSRQLARSTTYVLLIFFLFVWLGLGLSLKCSSSWRNFFFCSFFFFHSVAYPGWPHLPLWIQEELLSRFTPCSLYLWTGSLHPAPFRGPGSTSAQMSNMRLTIFLSIPAFPLFFSQLWKGYLYPASLPTQKHEINSYFRSFHLFTSFDPRSCWWFVLNSFKISSLISTPPLLF